ncbi:MAG: M42 family metallopeptidase [Candidatus Izemoplasmatales bacterium]|nr:M42 family metallopeptidase [Candidatus Izemoplasmatales bacterium]MDD3865880.1 M42 family metallopeptidase [Candidatus Izemoplasmatales bacterium]
MIKQLYRDLVELPGVSGNEKYVRKYVRAELEKVSETIYQDKLGSVFGAINEQKQGPKVMIAGHMDEVGAMVSAITDKGFIKMIPIGSINAPIMLSQHLDIIIEDGSAVPGVVASKPPHLLRDGVSKQVTDFDDFLLDIGADSKQHACELGIKIGQMIIPHNNFTITKDGKKFISKAWDDRFGVGMAIEILQSVDKDTIPCQLYCGANVQEEVGLRGAATSASMIKPDLFIAVDCSPCTDTFEDSEIGGSLGGGFMIRFYDPRCIMHQGMREFIETTAKNNNIKFQYYKSGGGTDAAQVQLTDDGVLVCTIGMPSRYIHSTTSMIHIDDYEAVKAIILALLKELDFQKINDIKANV